MNDPFQLLPVAQGLAEKADMIRSNLGSHMSQIDGAARAAKANASILDAMRRISSKHITKIEIKVFYESEDAQSDYTFIVSDGDFIQIILKDIKRFLVKITKESLGYMRRLTRRKIFRV
jgi:hypothetical protein